MNRNDFREWLAVAVLVASFPAGAIAGGVYGHTAPANAPTALGFLFVVACIGIYVGRWPPIEYALALVIACVLAALLLPRFPAAIGLPAAGCAYLWGGWLASLVDRPV